MCGRAPHTHRHHVRGARAGLRTLRESESEGERCGRGRGWDGRAAHLAVPPLLTLTACRLLSLHYLFHYPSGISPFTAFFVRVG